MAPEYDPKWQLWNGNGNRNRIVSNVCWEQQCSPLCKTNVIISSKYYWMQWLCPENIDELSKNDWISVWLAANW